MSGFACAAAVFVAVVGTAVHAKADPSSKRVNLEEAIDSCLDDEATTSRLPNRGDAAFADVDLRNRILTVSLKISDRRCSMATTYKGSRLRDFQEQLLEILNGEQSRRLEPDALETFLRGTLGSTTCQSTRQRGIARLVQSLRCDSQQQLGWAVFYSGVRVNSSGRADGWADIAEILPLTLTVAGAATFLKTPSKSEDLLSGLLTQASKRAIEFRQRLRARIVRKADEPLHEYSVSEMIADLWTYDSTCGFQGAAKEAKSRLATNDSLSQQDLIDLAMAEHDWRTRRDQQLLFNRSRYTYVRSLCRRIGNLHLETFQTELVQSALGLNVHLARYEKFCNKQKFLHQ